VSKSAEECRMANRALVEQQIRQRPVIAFGIPNVLIVETGAVCSLRCPFCPKNHADFDLSRRFLRQDDFKRIVDSFEGLLDSILLFNWGEPLFNPQIPEMVRYAAQRKISTTIHSNLNSLAPEFARRLIEAGLSELVASIDGASEESYRAYRRGGSFAKALNNLKVFIETKKSLSSDSPRIQWKFLVFRQNEHEIEKARLLAEEIGVPIQFSLAVAPGVFESTLDEYNNKDFAEKFIKNYGLPCEQLWKSPVICPDGEVLPCCMVNQKKYSVGNLFKEEFSDIWNNSTYQALRRIISGEVAADRSFFCHDCIFNPKNARAKQS